MQPKRIVLASIGSLGDLHPVLALALALSRRGHHVVLAAPEPYAEAARTAALAFAPLGPVGGEDLGKDPAIMARIMNLRRGPEYLIRELIMPGVPAMFRQLRALCLGADLLVAG